MFDQRPDNDDSRLPQAPAPGAVAAVVGAAPWAVASPNCSPRPGQRSALQPGSRRGGGARAAIAADLESRRARKARRLRSSAVKARLLPVDAYRGSRAPRWSSRRSSGPGNQAPPVGRARVLPARVDSRHKHELALGGGDCRRLCRPERVAGFHFFNPAPVMKVVEVVAAVRTDTPPATPSPRSPSASASAVRAPTRRASSSITPVADTEPRACGSSPKESAAGGARCRVARRLWFQARPLRAPRSDRSGRLTPGHGIDLSPVLRRAALPPPGVDAGCSTAGCRPETRRGILPIRRRPGQSTGP